MVRAPARVVLVGGVADRCTGGATEFQIEAKTLYDIIKALDERYPGLGEYLEEASVAIDGDIHEVVYHHPLRPGCEIYFIPKIEGG